ncbi:glycosyltransferase [Sulfitobacter sp. DSM 110093]|uniref:glycosyltransferase n=1 Tax=Sulfitobacter sp. DSM 110093 TaxID=2883127 RepID=UPI001FAD9DE3|nr:glycosyltransferase [Sulfitobacter sp. DSM 110093]
MIPQYLSVGISVRFRGWDRVRGEAVQWKWTGAPIDEAIILSGGGHSNRLARAMYPIWMLRVFFFVLLASERQTFHCLGWETAFPATLAALLRRHPIIFDDADRFSMILGLTGALRSVVMALEDWTAARSALHIIPSRSRHTKQLNTDFVLPNTPTAKDLDLAAAKVAEKPAGFVVYANGWLPDTRGALLIAEAFKRFANGKSDVALLIAGFVPDEIRDTVIDAEYVNYKGEMPQVEALALYKASDVLLTFYDPAVEINRYAEPNKWGDAMCFGVPFIVNSEVETAREFIDAGVAFAVPYGDPDALAALLTELYENPERLQSAVRNFGALPEIVSAFDARFQEAIDQVFPRERRN